MRRFTRVLALLITCLLLVGILPATAQEDRAQRNKKAYQDALAQLSAGKPRALYQLYADPYQSNQGGAALQDTSPQDAEVFGNALLAAIPDLQVVPDVAIAQNDLVAASVTYSGTFSKPFSFAPMGANPFPPTNKPVTWTEMNFLRFNGDGKIIEQWVVSSPTDMLIQLGVIPPQQGGGPPVVNPLTDPVGYKTLNANELAATFSSGMEARNTAAWQNSLKDLRDVDPIYADSHVLRVQDAFIQEQKQGQASDSSGGFLNLIFTAMPDTKASPDYIVAEGDWVASLLNFSGTFTSEVSMGTTMTLKPTGKTITWKLGFIDRFNADGKVVEEWNADDPTPLLQGLGLMPPAGPKG